MTQLGSVLQSPVHCILPLLNETAGALERNTIYQPTKLRHIKPDHMIGKTTSFAEGQLF